ncbi:MAG: ATP-dependent DNA ligase [Bacteroidia bacterium]
MKTFTELFLALDRSTATRDKVQALADYFSQVPDADALWTIALFTGRRPKKTINSSQLRDWAAAESGLSQWMLDECYQHVGDLAETLSLLLPAPQNTTLPPLHQLMLQIKALKQADESEKRAFVLRQWRQLPLWPRFLFNKLLTGGFRVGVSEKLLIKGLAQAKNMEESALSYALTGNWQADDGQSLTDLLEASSATDASKPYPFYLAYPLEQEPHSLGPINAWQAEWKWDGIRAQLIKRDNTVFLWSRGEELISEAFPELIAAAESLPEACVVDGELLCFDTAGPMPFAALQQRLGRKKPSKKLTQQLLAGMLLYDLLEWEAKDLRAHSLKHRHQLLQTLCKTLNPAHFRLSEPLIASSWEELVAFRQQSRAQLAEGLMLKRLDSAYEAGRKKGDWWKWKVDPLSIDAVLLYAQQGHGRRAGLFTDYTFALWQGNKLVTFTKAYSGLSDVEIKEVDRFIKAHTLEKFGPVRTVTPSLVFEIGFEGLQASKRHKSGVALRFPRILRWRRDKKAEEANQLDDLLALLPQAG